MVIQKINENGKIDVFQISSENFQWTFETRRSKFQIDKDFFPFTITGNINILKRHPGAETKLTVSGDLINFSDDIGVPGGTVMALLFPKNFIPDVVKFKDKPFIPIGFAGQVTSVPPGQFEILYSELEMQCAIIFSIHQNSCFGIKCLLKRVSDSEFPKNRALVNDDLFDVTLSREFLNVEVITTDSLKLVNETLNKVDLDDLQKTLNELLIEFKAGRKENTKSLVSKVGTILMNGTGAISNLTTIADSFRHGDTAQQFVAKIIEYITL